MKKLILTAAALTLSACGFTPMHSATTNASTAGFDNVTIEMIEPDEVSQKDASYQIEQALRNRLGSQTGDHILKITPKVRRRPYGLTSMMSPAVMIWF